MRAIPLIILFALLNTSAFAADRLCEGAVSVTACVNHRAYLVYLSRHPSGLAQDTSPYYMKISDPRYVQALRDAGGGGGGGGDGGSAGGGAGP